MEKEIEKIWKKEGKNLKPPSYYYATDRDDSKYYVLKDDSTMLFLIPQKCDTTFVIPKKYCKVEKGTHYKILDLNKLSVVSCIGTKSDYERFVIDYLVINPTC